MEPAHEPEQRFSLLDRYVAGRELAAHIEHELAGGRPLTAVLSEPFVAERLEERPYLMDDLLADQDLMERAQRHDRTLDFEKLERLMSQAGDADPAEEAAEAGGAS
jgi:hypothetical protein